MSLPASAYDAFSATAARRPDLPFLIAPASAALPYAPEGFRISYGEAVAEIAPLADAYAAQGYGRGSRVALLLENRPVFFFHWLALNRIGASIVPINGDMRPEELAHQMSIARPDLVVALPEHAALIDGGVPADVPRSAPGQPIPPARARRAPAETRSHDDESALLFTSGSTGKPKGCSLSNLYFANVADWYTSMGGEAAMERDREIALTPLPFFHMNALGCNGVGMMTIGGAIVPLDRFSARRWWDAVADSGATVVHNLGVIPAILLQLPVSEAEKRHKARFNFSPGVDAQHKIDFEARFKLPIVEAWAMTETGGTGVTDTAGRDYPAGERCIGAAREGMEYRIVDDEGRDVPVGNPGELLVRAAGPDPRWGFFSGYLGDPEATEAAWEGRYFHTGDVVRVDERGLFYFVDRKKSIIRRSGENISALEVEAALKADPTVQAVAATPVPDPVRGEEVFAFVTLQGGGGDEAAAMALVERAAERLSYHKLPGYVAFVEAMPLSSTQKLLRGQLKTDAQAAVEAGRAIDLRDRKAGFRRAG
ncbi:AMP-binding protein [Paracoccus sp. S-4012]|uniref:AMP-binding protein n=1 Tax=Paracoccus sp. S-4012 TaxID=2665648 RepID=UPI0012B03870|nr:AMP-binding protein [Paracoccus sp. S-4012]MRX51744.1 AMP-binding protein [Paracoccus sp. S-4012]